MCMQVIAADGELNAARALKEAAETISQSSTAMQLRYLQTLNIIAAERGSTIVFPIPIDMMGPMVSRHAHAQHVGQSPLGNKRPRTCYDASQRFGWGCVMYVIIVFLSGCNGEAV